MIVHITRCVLGAVATEIKLAAPTLMSLSDRDIPEVVDTYVRYTFVEVPPTQGLLGDSNVEIRVTLGVDDQATELGLEEQNEAFS